MISARSKLLFQRLTRDGTRADERIPLSLLRRAVYGSLGIKGGEPESRPTFKRYYLGERVPSAHHAWKIGEALRTSKRCPWMSGIITLTAFGRMDVGIFMLADWVQQQNDLEAAIAQAWDAIVMAHRLSLPNTFDAVPEARKHHIEDIEIDPIFAHKILLDAETRHSNDPDDPSESSNREGPFDADHVLWWIERELAKRAFYDAIRGGERFANLSFPPAYDDDESDDYLIAILALSRKMNANVSAAERAMLTLFWVWLNSLRGEPALSTRPVNPQYDAAAWLNGN